MSTQSGVFRYVCHIVKKGYLQKLPKIGALFYHIEGDRNACLARSVLSYDMNKYCMCSSIIVLALVAHFNEPYYCDHSGVTEVCFVASVLLAKDNALVSLAKPPHRMPHSFPDLTLQLPPLLLSLRVLFLISDVIFNLRKF